MQSQGNHAVESSTEELWCWGRSTEGQLGQGSSFDPNMRLLSSSLPRRTALYCIDSVVLYQ